MAAGWERYVAEAEIRRLALDYADAFLVRDAQLMLSLWAPVDPPANPPDFDAGWARALIGRWDTPTVSVLHVTNHLIWFDDATHAHGRVYCLAQLDQGEGFVDQSIIYEDTYVVDDARWRFAIRRHLLWFGVKRPEHPLHQPPAHWPESQFGAGSLNDELGGLRGSKR
jgi:hypothetical protein